MSLDQFFALFSMVIMARCGYGCGERYLAIFLQRAIWPYFMVAGVIVREMIVRQANKYCLRCQWMCIQWLLDCLAPDAGMASVSAVYLSVASHKTFTQHNICFSCITNKNRSQKIPW